MPKLTSAIDPNSPAFRKLDAHNRALRDELYEKVAAAARGGSDKARDTVTWLTPANLPTVAMVTRPLGRPPEVFARAFEDLFIAVGILGDGLMAGCEERLLVTSLRLACRTDTGRVYRLLCDAVLYRNRIPGFST